MTERKIELRLKDAKALINALRYAIEYEEDYYYNSIKVSFMPKAPILKSIKIYKSLLKKLEIAAERAAGGRENEETRI